MKNIVKEISLTDIGNNELIDYVERLFLEYNTRKDIIVTLFDQHKFDDDYSVLNGVPFKHYEKLFSESKIAYDTAMDQIRENLIPKEYQKENYNFEIDFNKEILKIYE